MYYVPAPYKVTILWQVFRCQNSHLALWMSSITRTQNLCLPHNIIK